MLDMNVLTNVAYETGTSPFFQGGSVVFVNFTAGALIVQGSDDDGVLDAYTTYATVPTIGMIKATGLPKYIKVSTAANVYMLA